MCRRMGDTAAGESDSSRRLLFFTACTRHEIIISSGPHPNPSCWKLLCPACKFAFEHIHLCKACGPLRGLTFQGPKTRSVSPGGRVASEVCEPCGSAWATLRQESLAHLDVQIRNGTNLCDFLQATSSSIFTVQLLHIFPCEDARFCFHNVSVP